MEAAREMTNEAKTENQKATTRLEVYTDGQCPLCRWVRERVEPLDRERHLEWLDYNEPEILARAAPRTFEELRAEMHVRRKVDGAWLRGFDAWREVLAQLPKFRMLAAPLGFPIVSALGRAAYKIIANNRYTIFGVPPPCDPNGVCQLHRK